MKNINISSKMRERIITGGLSLVLLTGGFALGRVSSNSDTNEDNVKSQDEIAKEYLDEYIEQRSSLEKEIDKLIKQKEELQNELSSSKKEKTNKTFYLANLIVIKPTERNNLSDVYILENDYGNIYNEYHNYFTAVACKDNNNERRFNGEDYVFFWEYENLFSYLTDEELATVAANDGAITTLELDKIEKRLRNDYQEEKTESNQLTK